MAIEGTRVKANARKHMAMSHERMLRADKELEREINALIRKAEIPDAHEDCRYSKLNHGSDLQEKLRHKEGRRARIRYACMQSEVGTVAAATRKTGGCRGGQWPSIGGA